MEDASPLEVGRAPLALVAEGGRFTGLVTFSGDFGIDGEVSGAVVARGRLTVGEKAVIRGRVTADEVVVFGRVEGPLAGRSRVELAATARVSGDVASPRLRTTDGCRLEGRLAVRGEAGDDAPSS